MRIPVLIEPTAGQRFRATSGAPLLKSVESETSEAALAALKARIDERLRGDWLATVELDDGGHPWLAGAGMFRDDPLFDAWQHAICAYRRETNEAPDAP